MTFMTYDIIGNQELFLENPKCIVVDIDGTLSNNDHREHLVPKDKDMPEDKKSEAWDAFFAEQHKDSVYEEVKHLVLAMQHTATIVIMTARENRSALVSADWLEEHGIPYTVLITKPDNDLRDAIEYKIDTLPIIENQYGKILFCLEDQGKIVKAMRDAGYVAFDVRNSFND